MQCYEGYCEKGIRHVQLFNLRTILLSMINDFPAYRNLSGCSVKGYKACPTCGDNTFSIRLKYGKKMTYLRHQKFISHNHHFRLQKNHLMVNKNLEVFHNICLGRLYLKKLKILTFKEEKETRKENIDQKEAPRVVGIGVCVYLAPLLKAVSC